MKVRSFMIVSFLLVSTALFGAKATVSNNYNLFNNYNLGMQTTFSNHNYSVPFSQVRSDTDAYGYYFLTDTCPGGPTFSWFDTSASWTKIYGLGDDSNIGPFSIAFDFPYYWYTVDKFYVNSNGCISFSDEEVYTPQGGSQTFVIPSPKGPDDLVIPLGADLTFVGEGITQGSVYYYTNNVGTLIISFLDVPAWSDTAAAGFTGSHDFQIVLCKTDSTILFQYEHQHGVFYEDQPPFSCAGIENVGGNVGLSAFLSQYPDSGDAIKFIPPDETTYEILDIMVKETMSSGSKGLFVFPNIGFVPWATIKNQGTMGAGSFDVRFQIMDTTSGSFPWVDTSITVSGLSAGSDTTLYFSDLGGVFLWFVDNYFALVQTTLTGDEAPENDSLDCEILVIELPGWLQYDSDPESAWLSHWLGGAGAGWGQEFEPPKYPIEVDSISIAMSADTAGIGPVMAPIMLLDDDGPGGSPGTILWTDTYSIATPPGYFGHFKFAIDPPVIIESGLFYIGILQATDDFPMIAFEKVGPFSRRGWENTGSWSPGRDRIEDELLMRFHGRPVGVSERRDKKFSYAFMLTPARPNPMKKNTMIYYTLPTEGNVTLKLYNLLGQEVRTLVNGRQKAGFHSVTFDAKNSQGNRLPQGVYFYRLSAGERSLTRKITLLR